MREKINHAIDINKTTANDAIIIEFFGFFEYKLRRKPTTFSMFKFTFENISNFLSFTHELLVEDAQIKLNLNFRI